nr:immunoglobulin heavy chain junction region [Macaca mulatta]MOV38096.1 immunoglobulin heavy chain junction region [Macaca mulatta]MOV38736.1 immunoglobulin heavy chain junction region [Macaca mulatta]MOV39852.1 immunoglobulin heavy chain junction region [Macaca mulatta]MOV41054.1 immunoglobulin heavy chain junction region [Macaca mulatta]
CVRGCSRDVCFADYW